MTPSRIWLLYGPDNEMDGHEPLLGVFSTAEMAGEWLFANVEAAREWQGKVSTAKYRASNEPYPWMFGEHCCWYAPGYKALRGWMNGEPE